MSALPRCALSLVLACCACSGGGSSPPSPSDAFEDARAAPGDSASIVDAEPREGADRADTESATDTSTADASPPPPDSTGPGAPRIINFATNVKTVEVGQPVVFTALVTDPQGVDDLIGGRLVDPESGAVYGAFATQATEGAYSLRLEWRDLQSVRTIDSPFGGIDRDFRAEFFDQAGNAAHETVRLRLACGARAVCGGKCSGLREQEHCGSCGKRVPESFECSPDAKFVCPEQETSCPGSGNKCVRTDTAQHCGQCGFACPAAKGVPEYQTILGPSCRSRPTDPARRCEIEIRIRWGAVTCAEYCAAASQRATGTTGYACMGSRCTTKVTDGTCFCNAAPIPVSKP
jgi:hypothetical protein